MDETPPLEISICLFTHLFYTMLPGVETFIAVSILFINNGTKRQTGKETWSW